MIPPPEPMRAKMDETRLDNLAASLRSPGQLVPLLVIPQQERDATLERPYDEEWLTGYLAAGGMFEIVDGHRRYIASERVPLELLDCMVFFDLAEAKHAVMLHAGIHREEFTAAEEGWQFLELSNKHKWSLDDLMRHFQVSEAYINDRVELVSRDAAVAKAVHDESITLAQAKEIYREKDTVMRAYLLDQAAVHGATARTLRVMKQNHAADIAVAQGVLNTHTPLQSVAPDPSTLPRCVWCDGFEDPENFREIKVHWYHEREVRSVIDQVAVKNTLHLAPANGHAPAPAPPVPPPPPPTVRSE